METLIWVVHVLSAISVIVLVLLQHGKGADMGAAFGSGSSGSLFGASGSANFLSRMTGGLAALFFITSLGLTYLSSHKTESGGVMDKAIPVQSSKPAEPAPAVPAEVDSSKATEIPK
ncbi:MAG: preprotein translocase subunit SecG [Nitrosospira sp.]|nr:preprotein translocase subunit SecG [Nitrosospira sp.]